MDLYGLNICYWYPNKIKSYLKGSLCGGVVFWWYRTHTPLITGVTLLVHEIRFLQDVYGNIGSSFKYLFFANCWQGVPPTPGWGEGYALFRVPLHKAIWMVIYLVNVLHAYCKSLTALQSFNIKEMWNKEYLNRHLQTA